PRRTECTNLLVPVCLSASHIGYASIRTEPVFMGTGEVCGAAAAMAIDANTAVQTLNVSDLQHKLSSDPLLENH
ncbi:MAG TPA: FAD-dependent oxidoreductase, partial [Chitinophaga sp.]